MRNDRYSANFLSDRSSKHKPLSTSGERMFQQKSLKNTRYNNMWKTKHIMSGGFRNKPSTSDPNILPSINAISHKNSRPNVLDSSKNSMREKQFGFMSMSPFRRSEILKGDTSQLINQDNKIFGRERAIPNSWKHNDTLGSKILSRSVIQKPKVQFCKANDTVTDFNASSYKDPDNRYLYVIPEGSDITSQDLIVIRVNLTNYVRALLPKDHLIGNSAKILRMGPYEKLEFVNPSNEIQLQVLRAITEKLERVTPK